MQELETLPRLQPWAFTKLKAFETCPRSGYAKYIRKDMPWVDSEAKERGREYHEHFERYINSSTPFPNELAWCAELIPVPDRDTHTFQAEVALGIDEDGEPCGFHDPFCWFRGKLDLLDISLNGTGHPDLAFIIDWKTGKPWEDPDELHLHAMLAKAHYPDVRHWRGVYAWLRNRAFGELHILSPAKTLDRLRQRIKKVESEIGDYPRKNKLCPWCSLSRCENFTGAKR